jgi:hypothetical protein
LKARRALAKSEIEVSRRPANQIIIRAQSNAGALLL